VLNDWCRGRRAIFWKDKFTEANQENRDFLPSKLRNPVMAFALFSIVIILLRYRCTVSDKHEKGNVQRREVKKKNIQLVLLVFASQ
jgi:hypothetical protein